MEAAFGIFIIVVAFGLFFGNNGISDDKPKAIAKAIDKELSKEFDKRDKKIEQLEKQVRELKER